MTTKDVLIYIQVNIKIIIISLRKKVKKCFFPSFFTSVNIVKEVITKQKVHLKIYQWSGVIICATVHEDTIFPAARCMSC